MGNFKELLAWRLSVDLAKSVYQITEDFPDKERFGLISQMRRAAVSIMSNIAEGSRRGGRDQVHFLKIAQGSSAELESQLILSREIGLLKSRDESVFDLLQYAGSVLHLYRKKMESMNS